MDVQKLLADLNQQLDEIAVELPNYFGVLPPQSVEIRRIPVYEQESAAGGYYTPPPLDGSGSGIYWINLRDTAEWRGVGHAELRLRPRIERERNHRYRREITRLGAQG